MLQIHVRANVKHIQVWLLQSLYIKLIWTLNISDVLIWETAGGGISSGDRREEGSPKVKWQEAKDRHHLERDRFLKHWYDHKLSKWMYEKVFSGFRQFASEFICIIVQVVSAMRLLTKWIDGR